MCLLDAQLNYLWKSQPGILSSTKGRKQGKGCWIPIWPRIVLSRSITSTSFPWIPDQVAEGWFSAGCQAQKIPVALDMAQGKLDAWQGEVTGNHKDQFLGRTYCVLFQWQKKLFVYATLVCISMCVYVIDISITYIHIYAYMYIYICKPLCVCMCLYILVHSTFMSFYGKSRLHLSERFCHWAMYSQIHFFTINIYIYVIIYICMCMCVCIYKHIQPRYQKVPSSKWKHVLFLLKFWEPPKFHMKVETGEFE